jgi:hypothetical protein
MARIKIIFNLLDRRVAGAVVKSLSINTRGGGRVHVPLFLARGSPII